MPPKSKAKTKAEETSRRSVQVRKKQLCSVTPTTSIALCEREVENDQAREDGEVTISSSLSHDGQPGPSGVSLPASSDIVSENREKDLASGDATDSVEAIPKSSQEVLGKFAEEWLQVLGKENLKSIACYHLVSTLKLKLLNTLL